MAKNPKLDKMSIEEIFEDTQILKEMQETGYTKEELEPILLDFQNCRPVYEKLLEDHVRQIRQFEGVHSITSRVKSVGSFCEKILRKRDDRRERITVQNYRAEIKDLLGIRALYVFPDEFAKVDKQIHRIYAIIYDGKPEIRHRKGDSLEMFKRHFVESQVDYNDRDDYRSIHYTLNPKGDGVRIELQTRTVFEEGWSEINHRTVYGMSLSENGQSLSILSSILSRMVGTCNDIGSLIYSLSCGGSGDVHVTEKLQEMNEGGSPDELTATLRDFINSL